LCFPTLPSPHADKVEVSATSIFARQLPLPLLLSTDTGRA
jgi:hypothetical protein